MNLSRRQMVGMGLGAAGLVAWPGELAAKAGARPPIGVIPMVSPRFGTGARRWALTGRTRIVTDDAWHGEAEMLARDLAVLRDAPLMPRIVVRGGKVRASDNDIVLQSSSEGGAEGYRLTIGDSGPLRIAAANASGVFYGGRTLLQLLMTMRGVPTLTITDAPAVRERGVTVDVGRKFYTMDWLKSLIRRMGWWKLNSLHLHLTDNEGFGYASRRHPQFASPNRLSLDDLRALVAYAAHHHVAIVPEVDSPGHLMSVLKHEPQFVLRASDGSATGKAIDVSNPAACALVADLIDELLPIFPGANWHLGGDEVLHTEKPDASPAQLDAFYPQLVRYARGRAGSGAMALDALTLYLNDLNTKLRARGKICRGWNDGLQGQGVVPVDRTIDVDYWENLGRRMKTAAQHLADGHRLLNVHSRYLYYVVAEPAFPWYPRPTARRIYDEWAITDFEGQDPLPAPIPAVIGGHLAIWADKPNDRTEQQIAQDIAAPLAALAQKTWVEVGAGAEGGAGRPVPFPAFERTIRAVDAMAFDGPSPTSGMQRGQHTNSGLAFASFVCACDA